MGIFKKFVGMFAGEDEEDEELNEEVTENNGVETEESTETEIEPESVTPPKSVELKVVRLSSYDSSIKKVADHLLKKRTVILNLEDSNKESTKRIIDFLGGVVYSIRGDIRLVTNGTYIITPNNVSVSNEQIEQAVTPSEEKAPESIGSSIENF